MILDGLTHKLEGGRLQEVLADTSPLCSITQQVMGAWAALLQGRLMELQWADSKPQRHVSYLCLHHNFHCLKLDIWPSPESLGPGKHEEIKFLVVNLTRFNIPELCVT